MRHAQVSTTMDVYGNAMMESKRDTTSKVVRMALRPVLQRVQQARGEPGAERKKAAQSSLFQSF
jgi:hypothetical protein